MLSIAVPELVLMVARRRCMQGYRAVSAAAASKSIVGMLVKNSISHRGDMIAMRTILLESWTEADLISAATTLDQLKRAGRNGVG